ncbi:MAG: hypothetical protein NTW29_01155 [Bacteroidetes bacterium]|nr:hypothetical protein [Bacteroidota bacterium]
MSERLPYEDQLSEHWHDLPLPNEDMAWADMNRRLDEEDRKPRFPIWLRGCAGWALLGMVMLGLGWWLLRPDHWFNKSTEPEQTNTAHPSAHSIPQTDTSLLQKQQVPGGNTSSVSKREKDTVIAINDDKINTLSKTALPESPGSKPSGNTITVSDNAGDNPVVIKKGNSKLPLVATSKNRTVKTKNRKPVAENVIKADMSTAGIGDKKASTKLPEENSNPQVVQTKPITAIPQEVQPPAPVITVAEKSTANPNLNNDSTRQANKDDITKQEDAVKKEKKDSSQKKKFEWSGGVGLQQQLPVAGQKWTPYNAQGRKGTLGDYIPSVYIRFSRPEKWFLQAEFRYGAPQLQKEQVYRQTKQNDTGSAPLFYTQNSYKVKKTYYHEFPLVFNYYIKPGWSVGAGIQWNSFYRAVEEREILRHNNILGSDSLVSKTVYPVKRDSATSFKRSFFQGVLETQYQWRRFSFGARYSFGLQPYIEFSLPGSEIQRKKIQSLQFFLRFQLFHPPTKKRSK